MAININRINNLRVDTRVLHVPRVKFDHGTDDYHVNFAKNDAGEWKPSAFYKRALSASQSRELDLNAATNQGLIAWIVGKFPSSAIQAQIDSDVAAREQKRLNQIAEQNDRDCANIRRVLLALADKCHDQSAEDLRAFHANALDTEVLALRTALMNMEA